jgi:hypothetical protein
MIRNFMEKDEMKELFGEYSEVEGHPGYFQTKDKKTVFKKGPKPGKTEILDVKAGRRKSASVPEIPDSRIAMAKSWEKPMPDPNHPKKMSK